MMNLQGFLLENGCRVWEKGEFKRIYLSKFPITDEIFEAMGMKDVGGSKRYEWKGSSLSRREYVIICDAINKTYYDLAAEKFVFPTMSDTTKNVVYALIEAITKMLQDKNKENDKPKSTAAMVMARAWEIVKSAIARFGGKAKMYLSQALKMAWAEARA